MGWPEYIVLALIAMSVGWNLAKDGEQREGTYSFWWSVVAAALHIWLLWEGGFFA